MPPCLGRTLRVPSMGGRKRRGSGGTPISTSSVHTRSAVTSSLRTRSTSFRRRLRLRDIYENLRNRPACFGMSVISRKTQCCAMRGPSTAAPQHLKPLRFVTCLTKYPCSFCCLSFFVAIVTSFVGFRVLSANAGPLGPFKTGVDVCTHSSNPQLAVRKVQALD